VLSKPLTASSMCLMGKRESVGKSESGTVN
jgi:hypothetical protein